MKKLSTKISDYVNYYQPLKIGRWVYISLAAKSIVVCMLLLLSGCRRESIKSESVASKQLNNGSVASSLVISPATAVCNFDLDETTLTSKGWIKTFEDNFNTPDFSKWNIWTGGAYNNELQFYQPSNLQITGGALQINAKRETVTGATNPYDATLKTFNYTSGRMECKTAFLASVNTPRVRVVARIKLPKGYGMWSAFWSVGRNWPTEGEIDFLEARGQDSTKYETNYFYGTTPGINLVSNATGYINANMDLTTCYHVYGMELSKDELTTYLDGQVVETKTSNSASGAYIRDLFNKSQYITLNLAVGGDFFNATSEVFHAFNAATLTVEVANDFTHEFFRSNNDDFHDRLK